VFCRIHLLVSVSIADSSACFLFRSRAALDRILLHIDLVGCPCWIWDFSDYRTLSAAGMTMVFAEVLLAVRAYVDALSHLYILM
jgi:hypothetical protein